MTASRLPAGATTPRTCSRSRSRRGCTSCDTRTERIAGYYWLLLAESHLTRRLFGSRLQRIPLVIALCAGIIGFYDVVFLFSCMVLRMQVSMSALAALTASAPAVPFVGPAVLGDLFGGLSAIPIALGVMGSVVTMAVFIALTR
jgi:hypothetical protein